MKRLTVALILAAGLAGCTSSKERAQAQRDFDDALATRHAANAALKAENTETEKENAETEREIVQEAFGSTALNLWDKCRSTSYPKTPEHQRACKKLDERFAKYLAGK